MDSGLMNKIGGKKGLFFIFRRGRMSNDERILNDVVLAAQLSIGLWHILANTPVGALLQGVIKSSFVIHSFGPFPYNRMQGIQGRVFKEVCCVGLSKAADHPIVPTRMSHDIFEIEYDYLGNILHLKREGSKLFVDKCMRYYITDKIWDSLLEMANMAKMRPETVFVRDYKRIWLGLATSGIMTLEEVMDYVIFDHDVMMHLNQSKWHELLLPINLSESTG